MLDNDIWRHLIPVFAAGFVRAGRDDVTVKQGYQPETIGANQGPTLYLAKLFDRRIGHVKRKDEEFNPVTGLITHEERQWYESTFQAMAIYPQIAADETGWTPSDLANIGAAIIQSDEAITALRAVGLGVLRVAEVRNPRFTNERDQFDAAPSFDFILAHEQVTLTTTPAAIATELRVERV